MNRTERILALVELSVLVCARVVSLIISYTVSFHYSFIYFFHLIIIPST